MELEGVASQQLIASSSLIYLSVLGYSETAFLRSIGEAIARQAQSHDMKTGMARRHLDEKWEDFLGFKKTARPYEEYY